MARSAAAAPLSYAVNAGVTDIIPCTKNGIVYSPDCQENGVFFSQATSTMIFPVQYPPDHEPQTPIETSLAYVAKHDGATTTILFGENMDASFWAQYSVNGSITPPVSFVPIDFYVASRNALQPLGAMLASDSFEDTQALLWQDLPDAQKTATPGPPTIGLNQGYNGFQPGQINQLILTGTENAVPTSDAIARKAGTPPQGAVARPSSADPGGFHMTFADGHAIFMSQDVPYQIYAALDDSARNERPNSWQRGRAPRLPQSRNPSTYLAEMANGADFQRRAESVTGRS